MPFIHAGPVIPNRVFGRQKEGPPFLHQWKKYLDPAQWDTASEDKVSLFSFEEPSCVCIKTCQVTSDLQRAHELMAAKTSCC